MYDAVETGTNGNAKCKAQ